MTIPSTLTCCSGLVYLLIATTNSFAPLRTFRSHSRVLFKQISSSDSDNGDLPVPFPFLIRELRDEDLGIAANILADSFSENSVGYNFFTKRIEQMNVYLSLKSRFETFRFADRTGSLQCMLVACCRTTSDDGGEVIAICEVDNRPPGDEINPAPRPYISNLAVDNKYRRKGVATSLIRESEDIASGWDKPRLHLQVYDDNVAAKEMYMQCGYDVQSSRINLKKETILLLGKKL